MLPHIAILDPRTGTQLVKVVGYVEAQVLSMAIVEFLENNSIDQVGEYRVAAHFRLYVYFNIKR